MKYGSNIIRTFGAAVIVVVLVGIALTPTLCRADAAGDALLQKCVVAEAKLKSLQASYSWKQEMGAQSRALTGTFKLQRPNRALIAMQGGQASDARTLSSDGKKFTTYFSADNEFLRESADPSGGNIGRAATTEVAVFFNPDVLNQIRSLGKAIKITGTVAIGSAQCRRLEVIGGPANSIYKLYVGPDLLLHGVTIAYDGPMGRTATDSKLTDLKADPGIPAATFAFALPKGAKPYQERVADTRPSSGTDASDSGLLPVGSPAPEFQLPQLDPGKLVFSSVWKSHKATLLCFWNNSFLPCREELPDLNKMLAEFKERGLEIVTVNSGDDAAVVRKVWKEGGLTMRAALNGDKVSDKYHVTAVPTNYLIGANGKIVARFEGFDETAIRAAIPKAGVK